jgi:hypothetical protein
MSIELSNVISKMKASLDKKRHVADKKLNRQIARLQYEYQKGTEKKYKSGKKFQKKTSMDISKIRLVMSIVKIHWFESYSIMKCTYIGVDYKNEGLRIDTINLYRIKMSWQLYHYNLGISILSRYLELQKQFDNNPQIQLKHYMIINELQGICQTIRIMYREKSTFRQVLKY